MTDEHPKNTITNDELAWLATGAGPMPASVQQRDTADVVKEMAAELLDRRQAHKRESKRAKQLQKLRWGVENLLMKVEALAREDASSVETAVPRDGDVRWPIPTLVWPKREFRPTIGSVLLEAQSAGLLSIDPHIGQLFEQSRVRLDGAVVHHAAALMMAHHDGKVIEVSPVGMPTSTFRWVMQ